MCSINKLRSSIILSTPVLGSLNIISIAAKRSNATSGPRNIKYEDDIISLNYDLVRNKLSDEEKDFISNAHCYSFEEEEEYSKEIINYKNNDKLEIIEEVNIKNYNNASSSEIEVNKTIFKVNEKHLLIIDQGDIHTMTTITNVFTLN